VNRHVRNICRKIPEIDIHQKLHYTGNILHENTRRLVIVNARNIVHNAVIPVQLFVYDEFEKLYEGDIK
jgi:hypothetical protein